MTCVVKFELGQSSSHKQLEPYWPWCIPNNNHRDMSKRDLNRIISLWRLKFMKFYLYDCCNRFYTFASRYQWIQVQIRWSHARYTSMAIERLGEGGFGYHTVEFWQHTLKNKLCCAEIPWKKFYSVRTTRMSGRFDSSDIVAVMGGKTVETSVTDDSGLHVFDSDNTGTDIDVKLVVGEVLAQTFHEFTLIWLEIFQITLNSFGGI